MKLTGLAEKWRMTEAQRWLKFSGRSNNLHPIAFLPPAERYLRKIKEKGLKGVFFAAINQIRQDPYSGTAKKGDLAGIYGYDVYHQGINYEIAYRIVTNDDGTVVIIIMAGTRENFYEQLKNYLD